MMQPKDFLNHEFDSRKSKNLRYSQRAYARDLELSAAFLSQVLSGKKKISPDRGSKILKYVDWPKSRKNLFLQSIRFENAKDSELRRFIEDEVKDKQKRTLQYQTLKLDTLSVIRNWYYHAFIALTKVKDFKSDVKWISQKLGISTEKVDSIVSVLKHLNLLIEEDGKWTSNFQILQGRSIPSRAIRDHHSQFLDNARLALVDQSSDELDVSGSTLAIDVSKIPQAKKLIQDFREQMSELLCQSENCTEVYRLSVQLFRVGEKSLK